MKTSVAIVLVLTGCISDDPITVDDVMPSFEVVTPAAQRVADGRSPIEIKVCRTEDSGVSKSVTATLKTSAGVWDGGDSDPKTASVTMSSPCETRSLVPPTDAITLTTTASIEGYVRTRPITLKMSPVSMVRLGRQGSLSSTSSSMLTISANLDVPSNGKPSTNTLVSFAVTVQAPPNGVAWFSEPNMRTASGASSVQTSLFVGQGVTKLTVTATVSPDEQMPVTSEAIEITP